MAIKKTRRRRKRSTKRRGHYITGVFTSTKTGQACKYRSGWELSYLTYLDNEPTVLTFGYESVKIPYVSNVRTGKLRTYFPDFLVEYVDGHKELVEIKPSKRVHQVAVQKKLKAAGIHCQAHGLTLVVITEHELKGLGLLK